jgi:Do/DeqQ family serine protease
MRLYTTTLFVAALTVTGCDRNSSRTRASYSPEAAPVVASSSPPATQPGSSASYADVVDRVSPAVVTIRSARRLRAPEQFPFLEDPFFRRFFGDRAPEARRGGGQPVQQGLGSGVLVRGDGHILTNHHVVDGADDIKVDLKDSRTYTAKLVGSDPPSDLAVLKIDAGGLPVLSLANSDSVRVGDICLALGNPLGIGQTVTSGIVSAKGRSTGLSTGSFEDFVQTDAAINQGNSGGALVNISAELIGINSQILSPTGGNIGIGFAIPSNMAKDVMGQLLSTGKVHRGQLGLTVQPVTADVASKAGLKDTRGVLVNSVLPGGPAERAGIRAGDVITALNGKPIDDPNSFRNRVASTAPGTEVKLSVVRDGQLRDVSARLGELKPESGRSGGFFDR